MMGSDKYKYLILFNDIPYPVKLTQPIVLSGARDGKIYSIRPKSSAWKLVRYENVFVYDTIINLLLTPSAATSKILVKIELWDNWSTLTGIVFEGYVSLNTFELNQDTGVIQFTPEMNDDFVWYDENKSIRIDLVNSTLNKTNTVSIDETSVSQDYWLPLNLESNAAGYTNLAIVDIDTDIQYWTNGPGTTYYEDGLLGQWRKEGWVVDPPNGWTYWYCKKTHVASSNNRPGTPGGSAYWQKYDWYPYENHVYHVRQQRARFHLPGFVKGDGIYQPMFVGGILNPDLGSNCPSDYYCYAGLNPVTGVAPISTNGNFKLSEVINFFLTGSGLTFSSQFFTDATNPVTGLANKFTNLFLSHNAYLTETDTDTTKGEFTLEGLLNDLCDTFNLLWYIEAGHLIIEHIMFFENGKQYSGTPGVYADLTGYAIKHQIINDLDGSASDYSFKFEGDAPQRETFKMADTVDCENIIIYLSTFAKLGDVIPRNITVFSTDVQYVISYPSGINTAGFCLIATDSVNKIHRRTFIQRTMNDDLFVNYPNGDLFFDNLIRDFWYYSRYFTTGKVNEIYDTAPVVNFTTQKKTKNQREIRFPRLGAGLFDSTKMIKTNVGYGEVKSYRISLDTDYINVILLYAAG